MSAEPPGGSAPDGNAPGNSSLTDPAVLEAQRKALSEAFAGSASGTGTSVATVALDGSQTVSVKAAATIKVPAEQQSPQARKAKLVILKEPKKRSPELIQRDQDRAYTHQAAGERSMWPPQSAPEDREGWQDNHHVLFSNTNLHPNYRSYFARFRNRRSESSDDVPGALKPNWVLNPNAPHPDEREAKRALSRSSGACAMPNVGNDVEILRHPGHFAVPPTLRDADTPGLEPRVGKAKDAAEPLPVEDGQEAAEVDSPGDQQLQEAEKPQSPGQKERESWSDRHHVTWCNERHTMGKSLNPMLLRSYFDRMRFPQHARCEAVVKPPLMRTLPEWRLRLDPCTGNDLGKSTDGSMGSTAQATSTAQLEAFRAPTRAQSSSANDAREGHWNWRHELVFKNEEVSRLDRCYFDRWKEPEANLAQKERTVRSLKPTWSLDKDKSPDATAAELMRTSARYSHHRPYGKWNSRHERLFENTIHAHARSYFGRPREPEDMAASRQRQKVTDADRLKIDWSLQDYSSVDHASTLRAASAPSLPTAKEGKRQKKRPDWFSSHGVVF